MARSTKAAVLEDTTEEVTEAVEAELTPKQVINEAITRFVEATGIDNQKARYKAMRAIAFQAFTDRIAEGSFDDLVDEAIANADALPSGWEIERVAKDEVVEAPVKPATKRAAATKTTATAKTPAKTPAKAAAAKPAARKRPTR